MNDYNWKAIDECIERNLSLWRTKKCATCETFDDIISFVDDHSPHARAAIKHGCAMPMTPYAAKIAEEVKE